jgi:hypothetical protein
MKITNTKEVTTKRLIALILAESGVGKTYQARFLPQKETLIISAEAGLLCLKGTDIDVCEISSMKDLEDVYMELLKGTKYKYIFIDSITEIAEKLLSDMKKMSEYSDKAKTFVLYGDYSSKLTDMLKAFRDLQAYSVIMTCLTAKEKDGIQMVDTIQMPGQKVANNIRAWYDEILHLQIFEKDDVKHRVFVTDTAMSPLAKDRSGVLEQYEEANIGKILEKVLS